jgi:hypothetical protein
LARSLSHLCELKPPRRADLSARSRVKAHSVVAVTDTFFAEPEIRSVAGMDVEWFTPTDHTRGPWDPDGCHAGPPTGLLVRAMERALPSVRLARITVDLAKPIPMAGFRIDADVTRSGRTVGATRAAIIDSDDVVRVTAIGLHIASQDSPLFDGPLDNADFVAPRLRESEAGLFPIPAPMRHGLPGFSGSAVRMRYPAGQTPDPGPTTAWMNTDPLLPGEVPSPFQRICPLADCGNAFSRHFDPDDVKFVNPDLTIALHRDPVGDWLGSRTVSQWQPSGIGLASATLFDDDGTVGMALQTMILRAAATPVPNSSASPRVARSGR